MSTSSIPADLAELGEENERLRLRLREAEETLQAIRSGEIDALLVESEAGERVFTLKGAEYGYRLFVEGMHEGAVTLRSDGLILYTNARFASLVGLSLPRVMGANLLDFVPLVYRQELLDFLAAKHDRRQEFELESSTGARIPTVLAISAALIEESTGGMCLIVTDIRDQKHLEQLLRTQEAFQQSQDRLHLAMETARLGSWTFHLDTGLMECSRQGLANLGLPSQTVLNVQAHRELIHPDDRPGFDRAQRNSLESGEIYECEYRVFWPNGSVHWILASGRPILGEPGHPTHMIGVTLDITNRKRSEEILRESESRFRTLTETIPQLSWTCLADGRCDYLSQQWIDYTGVPLEKQLGFGWVDVLHADDRARTFEAWKRAVDEGGGYDLEYRIQRSDGSYRWFKTRGMPVLNDRQVVTRWFGTCTEIEDIVQARQILNRDKQYLEELVRIRTASLNETTEQLNNFCYSIAHDLRAPLRAQQGYARLIMENYGEQIGDEGMFCARRIMVAAEKLEKLVQDLLSHVGLSRGDLPLERVELAEIVAQIQIDLSEPIERTQAQITVGPIPGSVLGHEASLNLILANLLSNALKYTKPDEPPRVRIWSEENGARVRLWIEDHGIGIKSDYHEKIFGVFQRLHSSDLYPGTGIGLALVRKGTERMGGTSGVISEEGKGSRFWIELPSALDGPPPA